MPKKILTHDECRSLVCLLCLQKGSSMRTIIATARNSSEPSENLRRVRQHFLETYDVQNQRYPNGLCARCRKLLEDVDKGKIESSTLPNPNDYSKLDFKGLTARYIDPLKTDCSCPICEIARDHPGVKGHNPHEEPFQAGRPIEKEIPKPQKKCPVCNQVIGRGIPHKCNLVNKRKSLEKEFLDDQRGREMMVATVVREKVAAATASTSQIELQTGGGKIFSMPNPKAGTSRALFSKAPITASEMSKVMTSAGLSQNQTKQIAQDLRALKGRNTFESNLLEKMRISDRQIDSFYACENIEIDSTLKNEQLGPDGKVSRPVFYCKDLKGLISYVKEAREIHPRTSCMLKIGIDSGGSFLKITLNICRIEDDLSSPQKKRQSYEQGASARHFKETGVKKLIPLAFIQYAKESQDNLEKLVRLLNLNCVDHTPAWDMKLALTYVGLSTAAAAFPCMYCECAKKDFADPKYLTTGGSLRSFRSIEEKAEEYQAKVAAHKGERKLSSKDFQNCEHKPLFDPEGLDKNSPVIHSCPPMGLHLVLGLGNQSFKGLETAMIEENDEVTLQNFLRPLGVKRSERHGGQFNGNQMVLILQNLSKLRILLGNSGVFQKVKPILEAMEALQRVISACFADSLESDYKVQIRRLADSWIKAKLSVTPKAHVVFCHAPQFLDHKGNQKGLGFWSEQASESVHSDFEAFWQQAYKRELGHPEYRAITLKCMATYAARHL